MVEGQKRPEHFFPISSENKEEGWKNYLKYLPLFLQKNRPTSRALPLMHRLVTYGAESPGRPEWLQREAMARVITDSNPFVKDKEDLEGAVHSINQYFDYIVRTKPEAIYTPQIINITSEAGSNFPMRFQVFMPFRGHVRQFGTRIIGRAKKEVIHAAHTKPLSTPRDGKEVEEIYIGLSEGLGTVFKELCNRADELMTAALKDGTLEDQLRAAVYFQMWGVSVVHPFVDANGRAFAAKLILDLNRMGYSVNKMPGLSEVSDRLNDNVLAWLGTAFLRQFLEQSDVPLMSPEDAPDLMGNPVALQKYMKSLKNAMERGIRQGIPTDGPLADLIHSGMFGLKLCLSRDGHIDRTFYDQNIHEVIEANRAAQEGSN